MEQLLPNQLEGAYDRDGKGLSVADAMPGGKQRFAIIGSEEFDWTIDQENIFTRIIEESIITIVSKKILPCLRKWDSNVIVFRLPGHEFFQMETKVLLTKRD